MKNITSWKVTDLHPIIKWTKLNHTDYYEKQGIIHLEKGTVQIDVYVNKNNANSMIRFTTNYNGRCYYVSFYKYYTQRFCTTLAKRFMAEVIELSKEGKQLQ